MSATDWVGSGLPEPCVVVLVVLVVSEHPIKNVMGGSFFFLCVVMFEYNNNKRLLDT